MATSLQQVACYLQHPGDATIPFDKWLRDFHTFLLAAGLHTASDERRRALLLHCLGDEARRQADAAAPEDGTFDETVAALKGIFIRRKSTIVLRHTFRRRTQLPGESVSTFVTDLRRLATDCKFADLHDEMVRDQLIEGTSIQRLREKLLMADDSLTLTKALDIAYAMEAAIKDASDLASAVQPVHAISAPRPPRRDSQQRTGPRPTQGPPHQPTAPGLRCNNCGSPGHRSHRDPSCKARGRTCLTCGKLNHFQSVCRSDPKVINCVADCTASASFPPTDSNTPSSSHVLTVTNPSLASPILPFSLNNVLIQCTADTGARVNCLSLSTYTQYFSYLELSPTSTQIQGYGGSNIPLSGTISLTVSFQDSSTPAVFFITSQGQNIIGSATLQSLDFHLVHHDNAILSLEVNNKDRYLTEFPNLFNGLGCAKNFVHRPVIRPDTRPVSQSLRRVPLAQQSAVDKALDDLLSAGIIEKTNASAWVSNLTVAQKKSGDLRICLDARVINKAIIADRYPTPTLDDLSCAIQGANLFTKLDLKSGYLQVPLHSDSRDLTCFITKRGLYRYTRAVFGMSSAGGAFQRMLSMLLNDIDGCLNLVDDILVFGSSAADLDAKTRAVLTRLSEEGLTLNPDKCEFAQSEITFYGLRISPAGITPTHPHIQAITSIPAPTSSAQVASFLGSVNFLQRFLPHYSSVSAPLRELLKKDAEFIWSPACQQAFLRLRDALCSAPILRHFDPRGDTYLTVDASTTGLGCVLTQKTADGSEHPVAFASRSLTPAEQRYSAGERECLAAVFGCERFHYYLYGHPFTLRTDHKPLTSLLHGNANGHRPLRIHRWTERLRCYAYNTEHIPGKHNQFADLLSRWGCQPNPSVDTPIAPDNIDNHHVLAISDFSLISPQMLADATRDDPDLQRVRDYVIAGWPQTLPPQDTDLLPFFQVKDDLSTWHNGECLCRGQRSVIPTSLRPSVLDMLHRGHPGISRSKSIARQSVWYPNIDAAITGHVQNCTACIVADKRPRLEPPPTTPSFPVFVWQKLQIDIYGPLVCAPSSHRFLLGVNDMYSRWLELIPMSSTTTTHIISELDKLWTTFGVPEEITTDNGPQFVSHEFEVYLSNLKITHNRTAYYNPQANSVAERNFRTVGDSLKAQLSANIPIQEAVRHMLTTQRTTQHPLTGRAPAEIMFGRQIRSGTYLLSPLPRTTPDDAIIRARVNDKQSKQSDYINRTRQTTTAPIQPGTWVRIRRPQTDHKLAPKLGDPHQITKMVRPHTARLDNGTYWNIRRLVSIPDPSPPPPTPSVNNPRTPRRSSRLSILPKRYPDVDPRISTPISR